LGSTLLRATALLPAMIAGCASYPVTKSLRDEAGRGPTFQQVLRKPTRFEGTTVIWGGDVIKTENSKDGSLLYVLQTPLDEHSGRPRRAALTQGRFLVHTQQFLDPELYHRGARVTVAGKVSGQQAEKVDKLSYHYPVVTLKHIRLWPPRRAKQSPAEHRYWDSYWSWEAPVYWWDYEWVWGGQGSAFPAFPRSDYYHYYHVPGTYDQVPRTHLP